MLRDELQGKCTTCVYTMMQLILSFICDMIQYAEEWGKPTQSGMFLSLFYTIAYAHTNRHTHTQIQVIAPA